MPEEAKEPTQFGRVWWTAQDIQKLRPEWDVERCEEFLSNVEEELVEHMIGKGWDWLDWAIRVEADK